MSDVILIELIKSVPSFIGAVAALIAATATIWNIRISMSNHRVMKRVEAQSDGMLEKISAAAEAKGVKEGHADGVAAGALAEQNRDKA